MMNWIWTDHIIRQISERGILRENIEKTLSDPDEVLIERTGREVYQKIIAGFLYRVITENERLITAYFTSKIEKYYKGR